MLKWLKIELNTCCYACINNNWAVYITYIMPDLIIYNMFICRVYILFVPSLHGFLASMTIYFLPNISVQAIDMYWNKYHWYHGYGNRQTSVLTGFGAFWVEYGHGISAMVRWLHRVLADLLLIKHFKAEAEGPRYL